MTRIDDYNEFEGPALSEETKTKIRELLERAGELTAEQAHELPIGESCPICRHSLRLTPRGSKRCHFCSIEFES